ncbi:MAG: PAS domain S-box protein [Gammaproteobacteria bacterium]|nr:PAS domain S-box protein [Gammaproteobacteria bacterium]
MTDSDLFGITRQPAPAADSSARAVADDIPRLLHQADQDDRLQLELIRVVYQNSQLAVIATLIALPIVALLIRQQGASEMLWPWVTTVALVTLLRTLYLHLARANTATPAQVPRLRRNYLLWNFASGAAWGATALLVTPDSLPSQVFLALILGGIAAVAVVVHGAMFSAVAVFTLPALLPMVVRLQLEHTQLHTAMSIAAGLFVCILLMVASRMGKTSARALRLSIVNRDLATYLEGAKQATDHLNSVLTAEVDERRQIEARLRTERDFVSAVLDTECGLVIVLDPEGRIVRFNRACETATGYYAHELIGRLIWDTLMLPSETPYMRLKMEAVLAGCFPNECEVRWRGKQGGERRVRLSNTALIDKSGKPTHIVATGIDITEHYVAETELARSREDFRLLVEGVSNYAIYMLDPEGRITSWNTGAERITGYQSQDVIGTHYSRFYTVEDVQRGRPSIQLRMASSEGRHEYEGWNVRKGGGRFWATVTVSPLRGEDRGLRGFSVITGDITHRKQTEDTIRALLSITEQLNATLDIDLLMDALVRQALKLLDASAGYAGLFQDGSFEYNRYYRDQTSLPVHGPAVQTKGFPGHVHKTRLPYRSADVLHDPLGDTGFCRTQGIRTAICCPILSYSGEVIGFIEVNNKNSGGAFSATDEERLISVSQSAALAIQNALAFQQIKRTKNLLSEETRLLKLIATGSPLPTVISALLSTIESQVEDTSAMFLFGDAEKGTLRQCMMPDPDTTPPLPPDVKLPIDLQRIGQPLAKADGAPIYDISNDDAWTHLLGVAMPADGRQRWLCPIRTSDSDHMGMFVLSLNPDTAKHSEHIALIETTAHLAGIAVERRCAERALHESREQLRALSTHLQKVREEEKAHLARELHDELGGTLLALKIDTAWIKRHLPEQHTDLADKAGSMLALLDSAVTTTRRISSDLRPPMLDDLGLIATIEWQTHEFESRMGIGCELDLDGDSCLLTNNQSTALFRIFQEALTNIARHAHATHASIKVHITTHQAIMVIEDNGRGIDRAHARRPDAHGLLGMTERVHSLGGEIQLNSPPGRGLCLEVNIPLENQPRHPAGNQPT